MMLDRRAFLAFSTAVFSFDKTLGAVDRLHIATNTYPWRTFALRDKTVWGKDVAADAAAIAATGIHGVEPAITSSAEIPAWQAALKATGLQMRSLYMNAKLHEEASAERVIAGVLAVAEAVSGLGTKTFVINPEPIRWGGPEDKSDAQLLIQSKNLNRLGRELRKSGITLAYHNHDAEMRRSAREFHHMLLGTDPENVALCLDSHWIYRGAGDSQVALFDILSLYIDRVVELHLRQSREGVWTEAFGTGDIDYARLIRELISRKRKPLIVLEQAVEARTPKSLDVKTAHEKGMAYAQELCAGLQ